MAWLRRACGLYVDSDEPQFDEYDGGNDDDSEEKEEEVNYAKVRKVGRGAVAGQMLAALTLLVNVLGAK